MHTIFDREFKSFTSLNIKTPSSNLEVVRSKEHRVTVEVDLRQDPYARILSEDTEAEVSGGTLRVRIPANTGNRTVTRNMWGGTTTSVTGSNLKVKTTVYCPDLGSLHLGLASGNAFVGVAVNGAYLKIASGTAELKTTGNVIAELNSGVLDIESVRGPLTLNSQSGTTRIGSYTGRSAEISIASGNLTIGDASGAGGSMNLRVMSGSALVGGARNNHALTVTHSKASGSVLVS